jgi:hypothetical protein
MEEIGNFSDNWCPDCGGTALTESNIKYSFPVRAIHPETQFEFTDNLEVEHVGLKCGICKFVGTDYRGENIRLAAQRDWIFEKTGILIDEMGNRIN